MFAQASAQGSPPRMRGKDRRAVQGGIPAGITPAYAGKSPVVRERFLPAQDHPRVCGEKRSAGLGGRDGLGSPPRMRGKDRKDTDDAGITGITPAYAGKSPPAERSGPIRWDHPRVCGEKMDAATIQSGNAGSPPRMRGKDNQTASAANSTGITPAYAGKSHCHPGQCGRNGDHPRVCGEKKIQAQKDYRRLGSPPRMRGKVSGQEREQAHRGDHPRVCGEKSLPPRPMRAQRGSPPRMRGKD